MTDKQLLEQAFLYLMRDKPGLDMILISAEYYETGIGELCPYLKLKIPSKNKEAKTQPLAMEKWKDPDWWEHPVFRSIDYKNHDARIKGEHLVIYKLICYLWWWYNYFVVGNKI